MSDQQLSHIFSALDRVLETDSSNAFTMPGDFYTSEDFLEIEREQLFRKKWQCLGREEEVKNEGDYFVTDIVGEPIVIIRSNNKVKAMSNVCRHRGMPLMVGSGNTKRMTCSYHAWTYSTDGALVRAPEFEGHQTEFVKSCRLPEFQCEVWHGFIFVNLDANAASFVDSESIQALDPLVANMHMEDMVSYYSVVTEWDTNWKCLVENYMEGYHISTVHRKTIHPYTPTKLSEYVPAGGDYFGFYSYYPEDAEVRGDPHPDMTEVETKRSFMLCLPPAMGIGLSGFKATYNMIQPISATRMRTRTGMIGQLPVTDEDKEKAAKGVELFKTTYPEDEAQLVKLMGGLKSRSYQSSVLAPRNYEGTIWDFYRYFAKQIER